MRNSLLRWGARALCTVLLVLVVWLAARISAAQPKQQRTAAVGVTNSAPVGIPLAALPLFRDSGSLTSRTDTSAEAFVRFPSTAPSSQSSTSMPVGAWIRAMTTDPQGNLWIATEDRGVFRLNPNGANNEPGTRFSVANGLGDDHVYSLACDTSGRMWAGHLNHGLSVFSPQSGRWQNYDVLDGPVGERIFSIKVNPAGGDVWAATSKGLTRYSAKQDTWSYDTKADGLPTDQVQVLAFGKDGTLYVGTQCDGLAIGSPSDNYKTWRVVKGADKRPLVPVGDGLPSNLINDLLVARDGTVWVATATGLAWSKDQGSTWRFVRGQNWFRQGGALAEDYVTCLAEDPSSGLLWVGYRERGCGVLDPASMRYAPLVDGVYATTILFRAGQPPLLGTYGDGLIEPLENKPRSYVALPSSEGSGVGSGSVSLPSPAPPPNLASLNAMLQEVGSVAAVPEGKQPTIVALDDDWRTQGDWLGRYGRYWASLAGLPGGKDYIWGAGHEPVAYAPRMGPNCKPGDELRYWIQWMYTDDPRCLEMPPIYLDSRVVKGLTKRETGMTRRAAEWDDHGEGYSMLSDGPNIYYTVQIPPGLFYLSLYEVNLNGNIERNRYRDFVISVRPHDPGRPLNDIARFHQQPEWAHTRVRDFYGGVWKRFLVRGPTHLTIEVNRNYSFNSMLAAVMLDLVDEDPPPYFHAVAEWGAIKAARQSALVSKTPRDFQLAGTEAEATAKLVEALQRAQLVNPEWWAANQARYSAILARLGPDASVGAGAGTVFYNLRLHEYWEGAQRIQGLIPARDIEQSLRWDGVSSCSGKGRQFIESKAAIMKGGN